MSVAWSIAALLFAIASGAGILYQLAAARLLRRFMLGERPRPPVRPPVSVLKPLCGEEPYLADNLRSFCNQDYPSLQLVFG